LDDSNGDKNSSIERQAIPNKTLKGFDKIDLIKEELEKACPGVVSCADTVSIATRDGIVLVFSCPLSMLFAFRIFLLLLCIFSRFSIS
jgi:hypothetical protein